MSGFGGTSDRALFRDLREHPDFVRLAAPRYERIKVSLMTAPAAIGGVAYRDTTEVAAECALVADAPFAETFMTAPSPGIVAAAMENRHYPTREEYVHAVADALRTEYRYIADQGLLLQIDAPDLAMERHTMFADQPLDDFLAWVALVVDNINRALDGHRARARAIARVLGQLRGTAHARRAVRSDPAADLRSQRRRARDLDGERRATSTSTGGSRVEPLPAGMDLIAGVIDTTNNYVEHPEVVADRLVRVAEAVGDPHRIIAGTDCGFDTSAGIGDVAPSVVWEKLRSLRAGADLATTRLL